MCILDQPIRAAIARKGSVAANAWRDNARGNDRSSQGPWRGDYSSGGVLMSAGLLTIAYGPHKYMRMAEALALSYRRWNPTLPFCVVTDQANAERLAAYYDIVRII